jgi:hypothetical protein
MHLTEQELLQILSKKLNQLLLVNNVSITDIAKKAHPEDPKAMESFRSTLSHIKTGKRSKPSYYSFYKIFVNMPGFNISELFPVRGNYSQDNDYVRVVNESASEYGKTPTWIEEKLAYAERINSLSQDLLNCRDLSDKLKEENQRLKSQL